MPVARASDIAKSLGPPATLVFLLPIMLITMMMLAALNGAVVVDCTPLWVVLADPVAKSQQSFSLANVEVAFDFEKNRLQLTLYR